MCVLGSLGQSSFLRHLIVLVFSYFLEVNTIIENTKEATNFDEMFKLADLLEGVSVDCAEHSVTLLPGNYILYNIA